MDKYLQKQMHIILPETRAPPGNEPAKPAALFWMTVGSGGLHIIMSSWSDCITTPGNCGNQIRTWTNP